VGDHALEYMTGGIAVILGATGRNLGAGMSGGIAYVLDLDPEHVNREMVDLDPLSTDDYDRLHGLLRAHAEETESAVATSLLADWPASARRFTLVMPRDYKRVLRVKAEAEEKGMDPMIAIMGGLNG